MRSRASRVTFLAFALLASACGAPLPPGPDSSLDLPCTAPLLPGETDPAVRDMTIFIYRPGGTNRLVFQTCIVSKRFRRLATVQANVAVIPPPPSVVPPGVATWLSANPVYLPTELNGGPMGIPHLVVLLTGEIDNSPPSGADPVFDHVAVQLTYQTCQAADGPTCSPGATISRVVAVPAKIIRAAP